MRSRTPQPTWAEFDCANCGMHIVSLGLVEPPAHRQCAHCQWFAGWIDDPQLCRILDPDNRRRPPRKGGDGSAS
jgi:hypothetical protein